MSLIRHGLLCVFELRILKFKFPLIQLKLVTIYTFRMKYICAIFHLRESNIFSNIYLISSITHFNQQQINKSTCQYIKTKTSWYELSYEYLNIFTYMAHVCAYMLTYMHTCCIVKHIYRFIHKVVTTYLHIL